MLVNNMLILSSLLAVGIFGTFQIQEVTEIANLDELNYLTAISVYWWFKSHIEN